MRFGLDEPAPAIHVVLRRDLDVASVTVAAGRRTVPSRRTAEITTCSASSEQPHEQLDDHRATPNLADWIVRQSW
jgi:hypothetical protein